MKRLCAIAMAALLLTCCATSPTPETTKTEHTFFDAAVVETFIPGKTTQEDVRKALGEPYPDPLKTPGRWTYMYTYQKQVILTFDKGMLKDYRWSTEYGIGVCTKR